MDQAPFTCAQAIERRLVDGAKYRRAPAARPVLSGRRQAQGPVPRGPRRPTAARATGRDEVMELVTQPPGAAADAPRLPRVRLTRYLRARELRAAAARGSEAAAALRALLLGEAAEEGGWDAPARRPPGGRPAIALLTASGNIVSGKGSGREVAQNQQIASTPFCRALAAARDDPAIAAVVVRLDSQGGSAIASDTIAREMQRTRQAKPVVVSMARPGRPVPTTCAGLAARPDDYTQPRAGQRGGERRVLHLRARHQNCRAAQHADGQHRRGALGARRPAGAAAPPAPLCEHVSRRQHACCAIIFSRRGQQAPKATTCLHTAEEPGTAG